MERRDTEQRKSRARSQVPMYEPLIPRERLGAIYRAAETVAGQDESRREAHKALIGQLVSETSELDLLYNHAKDFLLGDPAARYRLIAVLNHIVRREGVQGGPPSETKQGRPIEGPGTSRGSSPHTIGHAELMIASSPEGQPCLVPPLRIADIFMGLLRICAEDPRIGGGGGICPDYLMAVGSLVERVSDLEMLYAGATDVIKGKDPRAFPYFEATLELLRQSSFVTFRVAPRLFSFSFGNPDGIPIDLNRPRLFTSPCADEKWAATADAFECFRELWGGPKYEIHDIINITPDREQVSRRGCLGDEIEIQGRNLEVLRQIAFPGGIQATEYTMLEDERIRFRVPEDARPGRGDLSICIDPGVGACIRFNACRLAERGTDHSFVVVGPPTIDAFSANGESNQVEAEACTDVVLYIHAIEVERAIIRDSRGATIWDSGERPLGSIEHRHTIRNLRSSETYTLEVQNLCGAVTETVQVDIYYALHLSSARRRIDTGDSVNLTARVSCPIEGDPLMVRIDSTRPDNVRVLGEVEILPNAREVQVEATAVSPGIARISAAANGYREATLALAALPVIESISPSTQHLNEEIAIDGRGFQPGSTFVEFQGADRVAAELSDANSLTVAVPNDADDGNLTVVVTEDGEEFESNGLRFGVLRPELTSIEPSAQVRGGSVRLIGRGFSTIEEHNEILFTGPGREMTERSPSHIPSSGRRLDNVIVPSNQGAITGPVLVRAEGRESNPVDFRLLREEGEFYEVPTAIGDRELDDLPIVRTCGATKEFRIELIAANQFRATLYVDGGQVGGGQEFRRHWYDDRLWVGGARISERHCSVGVVVDGSPDSGEFGVALVNANTGDVLSPDGINSYPKLHETGGIIYVEPRIWFSPDDTVAMIIAAAPEVGGNLNVQAHFIDIVSGATLETPHYFIWPEDSVAVTPYSARIENSPEGSQVVFSLEGSEDFQIAVP